MRSEAHGKHISRCNAVRHGLTAETVIGVLEDAEDYRAFEAAIPADYDAQSAVERELVLRLASVLWRLRRATTMETGLLVIQAEHLRDYQQARQLPSRQGVIHAVILIGKLPHRCCWSPAAPDLSGRTWPRASTMLLAPTLQLAAGSVATANGAI
jgi:hypothetical protein